MDTNHNEFVVQQFVPEPRYSNPKQTKKEAFYSNIWDIRSDLKKRGQPEDTVITFVESTLLSLTKVPKTLIKELLADKMIIEKNGRFYVNNKKVYCVECAEQDFNKSHTEYNYESSKFRYEEYEHDIDKHLERVHYKNHRNAGTGEIEYKITPEMRKEYFSETEPKFEIRDHDFEITRQEIVRHYRLQIEVKCKTCGYDRTLYADMEPCTKRVQ